MKLPETDGAIGSAPHYTNLLFQDLPTDAIDTIIAPLPRRRLSAGEALFHEGETGAAMYLVVSGIIEFFTTRGEEHVTIPTFMPGAYVGELALLANAHRSASARAIEENVLLDVNGEALGTNASQYPAVIVNTGRVLADQFVTTPCTPAISNMAIS